jgi:hypothetical protein
MQQKFLGLLDMLDGGGPGKSGDRFEGGPLSGFMNALGVRPMGYLDRMEQLPRPMPRPMGLGQPRPTPPMAPPPQPNIYGPGAMSNEELIRMILQALQAPPSGTGYGPR